MPSVECKILNKVLKECVTTGGAQQVELGLCNEHKPMKGVQEDGHVPGI